MARKRHAEEQELPFVALMDTMTNVVGVLTIVLVMVGISLARSANRIISALPPVTEEQLRALQAELDRTKVDQTKLKDPVKLDPAQLAALEKELAKLEQAPKAKDIPLVDLDALNKELVKRETELKQKKTEAGDLMTERDQLKTKLDTTPVYTAAPAKVVRLPVGRPIPEGAKIEPLVATKDGVYWLDIEGAKEAFLKEFKSSAIREMKKDKIKKGKDTVFIYDAKLLASHFEKRKLTFNDFQLSVSFANWTASPIVKLVPRGKPSAADVSNVLRHVKETPKAVVMFRVTADGFENYLALRERFDRLDVPAGWEFVAAPDYQFVVPEIQTNQPVAPPPPAAPAGPAPANAIKLPTPKLD